MSRTTRRWSVLAALARCSDLGGAGCTKNAQAFQSAQQVNTARTDRGLPALTLNDTLVDKAQAWAETMAANGSASHSVLTQGVGPGWSRIGENVGWARSIDEMHQMFMNSPAHRAAILDGGYPQYGVGVAIVNGRYYVAQVFTA
ncbi:hypothetical protein BH10ACT3_BH10ACT3_16030 [soil metagenome]